MKSALPDASLPVVTRITPPSNFAPARGRAILERRALAAPATPRKTMPPTYHRPPKQVSRRRIPSAAPGGDRRRDKKPGAGAAGPSWLKAAPVELEPDATTGEALARIAATCLEHLRGNEACLLARAHPEGAHQLRVALRRLRSVLRQFADAFPPRRNKFLSREGKWLLNRLAGARDWDVFLDEILGPVESRHKSDPAFRALRAEAERVRDVAYAEAAAAIRSKRYDRFVAELAAWAAGDQPPARPSATDIQAGKPVRALAWKLISRRRNKIAAASRRIDAMSENERHRLRIRLKRLRYTVDVLKSLFVRRRVEAWLKILSNLQDTLGALNDVVLGRRLLAKLTAEAGSARAKDRYYAAGLVIGWHAHRVRKREKTLKKTLRKFAALPPLLKPAS
jgi:CHAD domain-containing protein